MNYLHSIDIAEIVEAYLDSEGAGERFVTFADLLTHELNGLLVSVSTRQVNKRDIADDCEELKGILAELRMFSPKMTDNDVLDILAMLRDWGNTYMGNNTRLCNVLGANLKGETK